MIVEKLYVTPEEYLRREREAEFKSEYVNGEIIPMGDHYPTILAGASTNHNLIKENIGFHINSRIRSNDKGCRSMSSDQRVNVPTNSITPTQTLWSFAGQASTIATYPKQSRIQCY